MNLRVSYNWLKEFVPTDLSAEDCARQVSLSGPAVERLYPQAPALNGIVVGRISEIRPHPNADKLRITLVDVGKEMLEIVCGGTNPAIGQRVAVAKIGSSVRWHGEGEPVVLAEAEIRGVKSFGMIAAANEVGLADVFPHAEREILDLGFLEKAEPGTALAEALQLNDTVFDMEVTTNRPDAMGVAGMAREMAAILGVRFSEKMLTDRTRAPKTPSKDTFPLDIRVESSELCPRYQAVVVHGVQVGPSPWWMRQRLVQAGIRPISNVVDITNYVMLELGQPLHAFNYHALGEGRIVVRRAQPGEKLQLLDGTERRFTGEELVIADGAVPIAVAGVMGGATSGITDATTTVVLEAATFDPVGVRRTARALNLQTDASLRFEKGLSTEGTSGALHRAAALLVEYAGAKMASGIKDVRASAYAPRVFPFRPAQAAALIGVSIPAAKQISILKSLGFDVSGRGANLDVTVPWWRDHDIEGERDFTEEVARLWGYHNLPSDLPPGVPPLRSEDPTVLLEDRLRQLLAGAGLTEAMSYSFVSADLRSRASMATAPAIAIQNPLNQDLGLLRTDLLPSLLQVVAEQHNVYPSGALFEVANVYLPRGDDLPEEQARCVLVAWEPGVAGEPFFRTKGIAAHLLGSVCDHWDFTGTAAFPKSSHPGRRLGVQVGEQQAGYVAEIHPDVLRRFGIGVRVAVCELSLSALLASPRTVQYVPTPAFPAVKRDVAIVCDQAVPHARIQETIRGAHPLVASAELFDVFMGASVPKGKKAMAYHVSYRATDHTLTGDEAAAAHSAVVDSLTTKIGASLRE